MKGCFRVGLYRQGLLHDLSKYSPTEFLVGCRYYQGNRSPNNAEREVKGYSSAWLHHKGRNKHHMEYWIDYGVPDKEGPHKGENKGLEGMKMPINYVVEMFIDRITDFTAGICHRALELADDRIGIIEKPDGRIDIFI